MHSPSCFHKVFCKKEQLLEEKQVSKLSRKIPTKAERYFATGLSMITSQSQKGPNIMTAEWVIQVSYNPIIIAVFIHKESETFKNIQKTKEFGINVASQGQTSEVSVAGGYSRTEVDKIKIKNIFKIIKPRKIKTPLIGGCIINAECKLIKKEKIGDHFMLVGKVLDIKYDDSKSPLIYHRGRYFGLDSTVEPDRKEVNVSKEMLNFFKNMANGKFVLKCVGVLVKSKNKILVIRWSESIETIPFSIPPAGISQRDYLIKYLNQSKLDFQVDVEPIMKRIILKNGKDIQRINFVLYKGKIKKSTYRILWKSYNEDNIISVLV
ncbi:MAG: flavin reductase family protein [Thaumarchaeota archaeon]|nr:flavin reductase family protein [Nitrososphaerota archaeon]